MNCIDAVEGTAKTVLTRFVELSAEYRMDVSEYIRNVKTVIEGAALFLKTNPEVSDTPDILRDVLYDHAKRNGWPVWQKPVSRSKPRMPLPIWNTRRIAMITSTPGGSTRADPGG